MVHEKFSRFIVIHEKFSRFILTILSCTISLACKWLMTKIIISTSVYKSIIFYRSCIPEHNHNLWASFQIKVNPQVFFVFGKGYIFPLQTGITSQSVLQHSIIFIVVFYALSNASILTVFPRFPCISRLSPHMHSSEYTTLLMLIIWLSTLSSNSPLSYISMQWSHSSGEAQILIFTSLAVLWFH